MKDRYTNKYPKTETHILQVTPMCQKSILNVHILTLTMPNFPNRIILLHFWHGSLLTELDQPPV